MIKSAFRKVTLPVQLIIHNTDLLKHLVGREVTQRFRGSYLGILWNFIMPLITRRSVPAAIPSGRSVVSLITNTGLPRLGVSS